MNQPVESGVCKFLTSRQQYRACRVHVPDFERHIAAVSLDGQYYSFFKVVADAETVLKMVFKLGERGDHMVVIGAPKGHQIWIWEHEATPVRSPKPTQAAALKLVPACQMLSSPAQYQQTLVRVPDLDKPVPALQIGTRYFSIFRETDDPNEVLDLANKLSLQALDDFAIAYQDLFYRVCLLEPEARPIA
jgi:hypothetical protein